MDQDRRTGAASTPTGRIEGLTLWRALLMIGGVLLHATMGQEWYPPFAAINIASGAFRMGTFFVIAGMLGGLSLARRPSPSAWMRSRLFQLGTPTAFAVLVIMPATWAVVSPSDGIPHFQAFHMWFMFALMAYTVVAWAVHGADRRWSFFERWDNATDSALLQQGTMLFALGAMSFLLMIRTMSALEGGDGFRQMPLATGYLPTFLLGFALSRMPAFRRRMTDGIAAPIAILAVAVVIHLLWRSRWMPAVGAETGQWLETVRLTAYAAWCAPAAAMLILRSAERIRHVPVPLRRMSDASLTIYVLHYPVIALFKSATAGHGLAPCTDWAASVAIGTALPYLVHVLAVERYPLAALLLNGRRPARSEASGTAVATV